MRLSALLAAPVAALLACTAASTPAQAARSRPVDWPVYHYNGYRSGNYPSMPAPRHMRVSHSVALDGQVYASPIVHNSRTLVATENNTVYRFGPHYRVVWKRHLGTPSPARQRPCGNIDPLGITGTPAYSARTGKVYVAAELSGSPPTHRLYAIDFATGKVSWSRSLDLPGVDRVAMQERGALALVGSRVYVPFGGLAGDCGQYKGRVVGYSLSGKGNPVSFTVPTAREAGIWTPPGPASDRAGHILVAVGNGASGVGDRYDYSDSVLELSQTLHRTDSFSPRNWARENDGDVDLGSQGPAIAGPWIFQAGKSGTAYVLRRTHLGGIGGQVSSASVCRSFGGTAVHGDVVFVPCTDGLRAVRIDAKGVMHILWHAPGNITGSPVLGGGRVWALDPGGGRLYDLSMSTGKVYGSVAVGTANRFATPAIYGRDVSVPTLRGLAVVHTY
ncbi:MAG TPA: PQQ-binding-like beta-propeller repeat protein [Jatrophihabitans sp.]|nr:PQQ-binding-like beta-propeller repeat protein [Jatrophihabitans sp.]